MVLDNAVQITNSRLTIDGVTFSNLTSFSLSQSIIYASLDSDVYINSLACPSSFAQMFIIQSSKLVINGLTATGIGAMKYFARIEQGVNTTFTNWNLDKLTYFGYPMYFVDTYFHQIENVTMLNFGGSKYKKKDIMFIFIPL